MLFCIFHAKPRHMNHYLKITVFSIFLILLFLKQCGPQFREYTSIPVSEGNIEIQKVTPRTNKSKKNTRSSSSSNNYSDVIEELRIASDKVPELLPIRELSDIENFKTNYSVSYPNNGYSPYDAIYGKGIYHQTGNSIKLTAPVQRDIVFLLKDLNSDRMIRNEFIRAGNTFSLTKIPYGDYKFYYTYGSHWSTQASFKDYSEMGNFTKNYGISKSDSWRDFECNNGYNSTYTLKLQLVSNGNLETKSASEDEI